MNGNFKARAVEWALGTSKNGKEQIAIMFQIVGGEYDGKTMTWYGYFTENTTDRTLDSLRHCGWSSDSILELDTLNANEVEIVVGEEEYTSEAGETKLRSKVQWVNRPQKLALKNQMDAGAKAAFAAKMRGRTMAHKQKYGAQPAPTNAKYIANAAGQGSYGSWPDHASDPGPDDSNAPY